jgi:hypothetical protein
MITLLALLVALPILGLIALFAVPLVGALAVLAAPAIVVLAVIALPAIAIAILAGAFSNVNISVPVATTLEGLGIAVGVVGLAAALTYVANRLATRTREEALRPQEVPVGAREQVIVEPQREAAVSVTQQTIPADLAAQCQGLQLVPCPV